jgi:hypothetical protein
MDKMLRLAVADYAYSLLYDGESAPDFRWMGQFIAAAEQRYKVTLTPEDHKWVEDKLRGSKEKYE